MRAAARVAHGFAAAAPAERLARALGGALTPRLGQLLATTPRLQARLGALIAQRASLAPCPAGWQDDPKLQLAVLPTPAFDRLAGLAGTVFHGHAVARIILAAERQALAEGVGAEAHRLALAHRALAAPFTGEPASLADLLAAIRRDGRACVLAWAASLPSGLAQRLSWRLPAWSEQLAQLAPPHRERGPAIVAAVAPSIAEPGETPSDGSPTVGQQAPGHG
jgi:hypothetical protein